MCAGVYPLCQANLRAERSVTASLRDDLEKLRANHNATLKTLADTEMDLQSARNTNSVRPVTYFRRSQLGPCLRAFPCPW
jgi:hypothetical protein